MEQEIDLRTVLTVFFKNWLIILIIPFVLVVATTAGLYLTSQPRYIASATLLLLDSAGNEQAFKQDAAAAKRTYATYAAIVSSKHILNRVIADLKLDLSAERLRKNIAVSYVDESNVMEIVVEDSDPDKTACIANQIAQTYVFEIGGIMEGKQVSLLDEATVPRSPIKTRKAPKIAAVAAAGLLAAMGLVFVREFILPAFQEQPEKVIE